MRILVAGVLLAGPTALAFDSGGFFDSARTVAGVAAWALVALLAVTGAPLPRTRAAWVALGGLAGADRVGRDLALVGAARRARARRRRAG